MRLRPAVIAAVLLGIVVLTAVTTLALRDVLRDRAVQRHARIADDVRLQIRGFETTPLLAVNGLQGLFSASQEVTPAEFRRYAGTVIEQGGITSVGWVERVTPGSASGRPDAFPITYRVSSRPDRRATIGTDLRDDPVRWRVLAAARDAGHPRATPPLRLLSSGTTGVAVYAPVYRGGVDPRTVAARRARLAGFVSASQTAGTLRSFLDRLVPAGVAVEITDAGAPLVAVGTPDRSRALTRRVVVAGRTWTVRVDAGPVSAGYAPLAPLGIGVAVLVGALALVVAVGRRERYAQALVSTRLAEREAAEAALAESEQRQRLILETSADAIVTIDERGTVLSANGALEHVLGWTPDEIVGRNVGVIMPEADRRRHDEEVAHRAGGRPRRVIATERTVTAMRKDGTTLPVLVAISEAMIGGRRLFTGIIHDVSDLRRAQQDALEYAAEQAALLRIATAVAADEGERAILNRAAEEVARLLGADRAVTLHLEPGGDRARSVGMWTDGRHPAPRLGSVVPLRDGRDAVRLAAMTDRVARTASRRGDAGPHADPFAVHLAAPIHIDGRVWGFLWVAAEREESLNVRAEEVLERFAGLVALAVSSADARRQLATMASTDHLTGLWNQRAFHERLQEELSRARRNDTPLSLVVLDVDHFKLVNDTHGHDVGDRVLAEFARRLRGVVRGGETLARVGGEEFAWILPDTDGAQALRAAERAREEVAALAFPEAGHLTTSAGVCDLADAADGADLFRRADMALYWAKASGRDRTFRYSADAVELLHADEQSRRIRDARSVAVIRALAQTIDARDPSTRRHSERVAGIAGRIAEERGWAPERVALLRDAALVHDVGKVGIPDAILFKPTRLTAEEYARITVHAELGAQMVQDVLTDEQTEWVRHHHERVDGRGYPDAVSGAAFTEGARILAVADAWDAMTAARPYGVPMSAAEALTEVRAQSGRQFCADVAATLEALLVAEDAALVTPAARA